METIYTQENFKQFKKDVGLNNRELSEITGLAYQTVKNVSQAKELPPWARAMLWMYHQQPVDELVEEAYEALKMRDLPLDKIEETTPITYGIDIGKDNSRTVQQSSCGCFIDGDNIFRRGKTCKLKKEQHEFR